MIGLDTNVIIRYLTQDDPVQSAAATDLVEKGLSKENPGFLNQIVLCETVWVLEDCYGQGRLQVLSVLEQLLRIVELRIEEVEIVRLAVADYREGKADFSDNLIARRNQACGARVTYTFDKKASKEPGFAKLT